MEMNEEQKNQTMVLTQALLDFFSDNADKYLTNPIRYSEFQSIVLSAFISALGNILIITAHLQGNKDLKEYMYAFVDKLYESVPEVNKEFITKIVKVN